MHFDLGVLPLLHVDVGTGAAAGLAESAAEHGLVTCLWKNSEGPRLKGWSRSPEVNFFCKLSISKFLRSL